ncbi:MAG TPA: putative peptide maturation dehydrogenase [Gaiellaceae bacterium]
MARIRRTVYAFFHRYDAPFLAPEDVLRGETEVRREPRLLAISVLRGAEFEISEDDFTLLASVPSDRWVEVDELTPEHRRLADFGLLVSSEDDPLLAELRRKDEQLTDGRWNIYAALFHSLTRWNNVDFRRRLGPDLEELPVQPAEAVERLVERHGPPPPHFHATERGLSQLELPLVTRTGGLFDTLSERRTARAFDRDAAVTTDELATVLFEVFGCRGYAPLGAGIAVLKKTSPSGGSLHPIEPYVLVRKVTDIDPGIYHYRADRHALELIEPLTESDAAELSAQFTSGQSYFADASALFILTARFYRSFWKYRKHRRAYGVLLLDAGHLSQTLYLVAAELGLGAFVTAAFNGADIEERLRLEPFVEGVLAVSGFGRSTRMPSNLEPEFVPYVPRETNI